MSALAASASAPTAPAGLAPGPRTEGRPTWVTRSGALCFAHGEISRCAEAQLRYDAWYSGRDEDGAPRTPAECEQLNRDVSAQLAGRHNYGSLIAPRELLDPGTIADPRALLADAHARFDGSEDPALQAARHFYNVPSYDTREQVGELALSQMAEIDAQLAAYSADLEDRWGRVPADEHYGWSEKVVSLAERRRAREERAHPLAEVRALRAAG